ncbi:MAG: DUF2272 domain-containing protein [Verrucomicrobiales bacterium]|nr:DUF2272 domain-containing protein [Verrucomicrobiales bacterium]
MNKLLSFNPEPFETDSEIAGTLRSRSPFSHGVPLAPPSAPEWEINPSIQPRRRTRPRPTPPTPSPLPTFDSQAFRQKIVRIANQELARWGRGTIKEADPRIRRALQDYWKTGVGASFSDTQLADPAFHAKNPWSAAFISWVMRTAAAGKAFKYNSYHSTYTRAAIDNRLATNDNPFKAYRITELAPRVGDLICRSRAGSGATYDNLRPGMKTHCDIVTEVRPGKLVTVGGNVSNSVGQTLVQTDANGRIMQPNYFAVIRIDGKQPSVPIAPPPPPVTPSTGSAPRLIKQESTPAQSTLYVDIDLKIVDKFGIVVPPMTGIFIPDGYAPGAAVDLIFYLHGFKAEAIRRQGIDQYWNSQRFPYGALREGVNASGRNVILVAPTLGSHSEAKRLLDPGGLDAFIAQILAALRAHGPHRQAKSAPVLGNLIFACHSGGGSPMRQLAGGRDRALAHLRQCWGYDCAYNKGDDAFWAGWARARPNARVYIYYIAGSPTARLAESLRDKRVPNAIVQPSRDRRHNYVPTTHWRERIQGAPFLATRSGGAIQPPPSPAAPADVRRMTKKEFISDIELDEYPNEWEGEVNRNSRDYIRWVQRSLNKVLSLGLAVDGISGTFTRSAIRSFQQKQGLAADGVVGPRTEAALVARGANRPPGGKGTSSIVVVQPLVITVRPFVVLDDFAFDGASMPAGHNNIVKRIAHLVLASERTGSQPIRTIRLVGHTDPTGSAKYNLELAGRRARDVQKRLGKELERLQRGLSKRLRIVVQSLGETRPVASNTPQGAARNRRVEVFLPTNCQTFFAQYDLRFLPGDTILGIPANPNMTVQEKGDRTTQVMTMVGELIRRRDARAKDALDRRGRVTPANPVPFDADPKSLHGIATALSAAQLDLFREYLSDGAGGIDFGPLQECFEKFANGEFRSPHPEFVGSGVGEPEGGFYFLFAEFAFLCVDSGIDKAQWEQALRPFVKTQEIFMHVYRPNPISPPPAVGAELPSRGSALIQLDNYSFRNFKPLSAQLNRGEGQSDQARKNALRKKYDGMVLSALRASAGQNMLRALRMPL